MTTDIREHEAGDEILLVGSVSRIVGVAGCVASARCCQL